MQLDIFELARTVPIDEVIRPYLPLKYGGGRALALCPFHNDRRLGSFVVSPAIGRFKCFACGVSGDGVSFVSRVDNRSPLEAAVSICESHRLIDSDHAQRLREKINRSKARFNPYEKVAKVDADCRPKRKIHPKGTAEHLHRVYQCFVSAAEPLTPEFRAYLLDVRDVQEEELSGYFTFPSRAEGRIFWARFRAALREEFGKEAGRESELNVLRGVPGFFWKEGRPRFCLPEHASLGIVVRDRNYHISGIQMRAMVDSGDGLRYKFLSSGFADGVANPAITDGCSCGYVEDVVRPTGRWNKAIALTEGRFKAAALARLGFLAVNMHSISNWAPATQVALEVAAICRCRKFVLAYDAEKENPAVMSSAVHAWSKLHAEAPIENSLIEFAQWDPKYGKGIDDVIHAGNRNQISRVSIEVYTA